MPCRNANCCSTARPLPPLAVPQADRGSQIRTRNCSLVRETKGQRPEQTYDRRNDRDRAPKWNYRVPQYQSWAMLSASIYSWVTVGHLPGPCEWCFPHSQSRQCQSDQVAAEYPMSTLRVHCSCQADHTHRPYSMATPPSAAHHCAHGEPRLMEPTCCLASIGRMTSATCRDSRFHLSSFSL